MTVRLLAPAKINLGLEVIRKRADGFHDIATVFQTISLFDRLSISPAPIDSVRCFGPIPHIEANLVDRALDCARDADITTQCWSIELSKRIPVAAGLGGASSDAAATLLAIASSEHLAGTDLSRLALELGSDVPFLLRGGAALATGRGEILEPLPHMTGCWLVIASPVVELERKTARLYGALQQADFTDGRRVSRVAACLRTRQLPEPDDLANAFERPLGVLFPEVDVLRYDMLNAGAPFVALSGAGPTHFTIVPSLGEAIRLARSLAAVSQNRTRVSIARPTASGPLLQNPRTKTPPNAF